jgi:uncharacterized protein DUF6916
MSISRRRFLKTGALAGAALPIASLTALGQKGSKPGSGGSAPATGDALARLTKSDFAGSVGTQFTIRLTTLNTLKVDLYMLNDTKLGEGNNTLDNFSLIFRGYHSTPLKQNSYRFEHSKLGNFLLFIVPAGTLGTAKLYQAVFNRM